MPKNLTLGQFIAQRRKSLGWTQEQLADKVNVSKSAIAKWETDGGIPDRDNLYRLSNAIKISVSDLHVIIRNSGRDDADYAINITEDVITILESYGYKVTRPGEKENEEQSKEG